jgi:hypothetical protein
MIHTYTETRAEWRNVMVILTFTEEEKQNEKELRHQLTSKL